MDHQIGAPRNAWEAIRYFHAVTLDYVDELKRRFPNHDISITPSRLSPIPFKKSTNAQLDFEVQVWDRALQLAFEIFSESKFVPGVGPRLCGHGSLSVRPAIHWRLTLSENADDQWICWVRNEEPKRLDADFLLEQLKQLLAPLPH